MSTAEVLTIDEPADTPHAPAIIARVLRLNCLTIHYADLWNDQWGRCRQDAGAPGFTKTDHRLTYANEQAARAQAQPLTYTAGRYDEAKAEKCRQDAGAPSLWSHCAHEWTEHSPLRTDYARRQALVELDALAALALGLTLVTRRLEALTRNEKIQPPSEGVLGVQPLDERATRWAGALSSRPLGCKRRLTLDELLTIYRVQFPVLQQYEAGDRYDQLGRKLPTRALRAWEALKESDIKHTTAFIFEDQPYYPPFTACRREDDMAQVYEHFEQGGE